MTHNVEPPVIYCSVTPPQKKENVTYSNGTRQICRDLALNLFFQNPPKKENVTIVMGFNNTTGGPTLQGLFYSQKMRLWVVCWNLKLEDCLAG